MILPKNILLSRTDGIGDMALMLPMAGILKKNYPNIKIAVLGKPYSKDLVTACIYVDEFIDEKDFFEKTITINNEPVDCIVHVRTNKAIAKRANKINIPKRIGTSSRLYHWVTCTNLIWLKRKTSHLHEAQLNIKLLQPIGIKKTATTAELAQLFGLKNIEVLLIENHKILKQKKFNVIIHPGSQGSSRDWPVQHFVSLINLLPTTLFNIILTGVQKEQVLIQQIVDGANRPIINWVGQVALGQFISLVKNADALVANATGPVHVAAALGIHTIGLYPPIKPLHPGRWAPLGLQVKVFVHNKNCIDCKKNKDACACMVAIAPIEVANYLHTLHEAKNID